MRYRLTTGMIRDLEEHATDRTRRPPPPPLRHWGLTEWDPKQGRERITSRGWDFLAWRIPVQEYATVEPGKEPLLEGDYLFIDQVREKGARRTADLARVEPQEPRCGRPGEGGAG